MKTVTMELPDEMAAALEKLSNAEKINLLSTSLNKTSRERLEQLLDRTARQARENSMSEKEIEDFLETIS
jgi:CRISPR/Cas system CSM-associated protein Csm2 small subunit